MNLADIPQTQLEAIRYFADADKCHDFLVTMRWPDGVRCAHCQSDQIGKLVVSGTRRLWNCKACKKQFTAKVGTIFQDSPLSLDKWLPAVWMIVNAKNGVSSCELSRSLGITQKSAWHLGHRIRTAMKAGSFEKFSGEIEADETYVGGKSINMHPDKRASQNRQRGVKTMTPVAGLLERTTEGSASRVKVKVVKATTKAVLVPNVLTTVKHGSSIFTDAFRSYQGLHHAYTHEVIDHAVAYVRGNVHTNGLENFWSLLKRTLKGTYVSVDPVHLDRYLDEQASRFNERSENDSGRFVNAMRRVSNRRLTYRKLTGKGDNSTSLS
jgi:transposase-like protein